MKKLFLFLSIISLVVLACLEPERDNPYDPNNPDIVYLGGTIYGFDGSPIQGAVVKLMIDDEIIEEVESDNDGWYEILDIEPDTYKLKAEAGYYTPLEIYPLVLTSGFYNDSFDLYFEEIFFDFENEIVGTVEPHGFEVALGNWEITEDPGQPDEHSVPNVYSGFTDIDVAVAGLTEPVKDFWIDTKFKVLDISGSVWEAGIILRGQDEYNYYVVSLSRYYNEIALYKIVDGDFYYIDYASMTFSPNIWYKLSADFHGSDIEIYLNEELIFETVDTTFPQGLIGLLVCTYAQGEMVSVNFDDIGIYP